MTFCILQQHISIILFANIRTNYLGNPVGEKLISPPPFFTLVLELLVEKYPVLSATWHYYIFSVVDPKLYIERGESDNCNSHCVLLTSRLKMNIK